MITTWTNSIVRVAAGCGALAIMVYAMVPSCLAAAEKAPISNTVIQSYENYQNSGFAVRWTVDSGKLVDLLNRLPRYQYLVYFTTDELIDQSQGAAVQFGFFKTKSAADKFVVENRAAFSGLHTVPVSRQEHAALFAVAPSPVYWLGPSLPEHKDDSQRLFLLAKDAYINKQFDKALSLYSLLALGADKESRIWAMELVGVNYERLGKTDIAAATYRELLARYPEGAWVNRVEQRVRALETASDDGKGALRRSKYENDVKDFYWRGIIGQSYNTISQSGKYKSKQDTLGIVSTNFDLTAGTTKWRGHELETRLTGYDLMDLDDDGDDAKTRIKRFYLSYTHTASGLNLVAGRQRDDDAGVYGYFDGAAIKYPLSNKITIGAKAGVPVRFSDFYDALEHEFFSVYGDYQISENWQLSAYLTQQLLFGETDRAAYGGKAQYTGEKLSSFVNLDFDYEFAELNIFRWSGNYIFSQDSRISATFGRQRSPFLTATNIKVGQPYLDVEDYLRDAYNREFLLFEALSRTSIYEYGSFSYHHRIDEKLHLTADFYQSVSNDVPVFESEDGWITSDVSFYGSYRYSSVGVQAVASSFFGKHDTATMSYRFGDTTFATSNTLLFSERFRLGKYVFINPKVGLRQSKNRESDNSQVRYRVSLAGSYKPWKNTEFRLETGNEVIQDLEGKNSVDNTFLYAGYQARF